MTSLREALRERDRLCKSLNAFLFLCHMKMQRSGCIMFETKATQEALEFNLPSAVHSPVVHGVPGTASRRMWERFLVGRWQLMGEMNY